MKRITTLLTLILLTIPLVQASPDLTVQTATTDPKPLNPGDKATLYVTVTNAGTTPAEDISVTWDGHHAFTLLQTKDEQRDITLLGAKEDITFEYEVSIADDASTGSFSIPLTLKASNLRATKEASVSVNIKADRPTLSVDTVQTTPSPLRPGEEGSIQVDVTNNGERRLTNVDIAMDTGDTPFLPIGQTDTERFEAIQGGETKQLTYQVATDPSTATNVYDLPMTATFDDTTGTTTSNTYTTGIRVAAMPELILTVSDADITSTSRTGEVSLNIINKGLGNAKLLQANMGEDSSYALQDTSSYYIGDVESDDFDVITFTAKATNDTMTIPVELTYRTAFNDEQTTMRTVTYNVPQGTTQTSYTPYIIVALLIAGVIWWYKRR